ncbi:MAG: hypothetical protein JF590_03990, partial [Gemmatimonadetes bacterium]|nr:hypothetical protein [Gemmatimonadota bacterium]
GGLWVGVAWGAVLVALALGAFVARRSAARRSGAETARLLERSGRWRAGSLTGLLARPVPGTSDLLLTAADQAAAGAVDEAGPALLAPLVSRGRQRAFAASGLLGAAVLLLVAARPTHGRAGLLWDPAAAWLATTAPLRVSGPDTPVDRGSRVTLELTAAGRRAALLWLRAPGEGWRGVAVTLDSAGHGRYETGPLETDLFARLTAGGRGSDTLQVHVRIPAFLGTVAVQATYPAYLHLEPEPLPLDGDTVLLPAGTRLTTTGEATAELRAAAWEGPGGRAPLTVDRRAFHGSTEPRVSGTWSLALQTAGGIPLAGDPVLLPLRVVPDSAPVVEVPVPGADTVIPLDLRVPLVIEARDDHGLGRLSVESRRITGQGFSDPSRVEPIVLPEGLPDHAVLPFVLDLRERGLLPGDTVRVTVRAWDGAPRPQMGASREYVFRLPRPDEVRAAAREASQQIAAQLDSAAAQGRRLARNTEDLANERNRTDATSRDDQEKALDFEAAQRAQQVAKDQQGMIQQAGALQRQLAELQRAAEAAGASDPEWQRQLDDIRRQLDHALTPELRQKLDELQRALRDLDADRTRQALQDLKAEQQQLREALERSRELFRRAAIEGDLANLQAEAKDLHEQQRQWDRQMPAADSTRAAQGEQQLADRADSLGAALQHLGEQVQQEGRQQAMAQAAQQARDAAQQMRQASRQAQAGQRQQAQQSGQQAEQKLGALPDDLQQQRDQMQEHWRSEVTGQLDAALQEMSRLTTSQLDVAEGYRRGESAGSLRQREGAVAEGTQRVLDQLRDASGKNALVSPQLGLNLAMAQDQMQRALDAIGAATPNFREGGDRAEAAVDALNAVSQQLLRSRSDVGGAQSGSGMQEAMERMQQLAQQQQGVSQGGQSLLPMPGQGQGSPQMQALAAQQRAVAEQLERLRAGGQSPGAGELAEEARDLARRLEAGRLDRSTVERQDRLFHRMLDAGRTLQGEQEDQQKERQSTSASGDSVHLPPALRARLADSEGRLRMPTWEELQRFAPEERRLVVDYFRRLAEASR